MRARFALILTSILVVFTGIHYYVGWNLLNWLDRIWPGIPHAAFWSLFWLIAFSYVLARLAERFMPHRVSSLLKIVGAWWMAALFYLFLLMPLVDLIALVFHLAGADPDAYIPWLGGVASVLVLALLAKGVWNAWNPIVRTYEIAIDKEAGGLKELTVAAASDLHLGSLVRKRYLNVLVDKLTEMKPDLILLPGDILDDSFVPFVRQGMAESMARLRARFGIFAVLGNHEYFGGHIADYVRTMRDIGIEVLMDRTVRIGDHFYVAGRKDKTAERMPGGGRLSHEALLAEVDKALPVFLLDHQPYGFDSAAASGVDVMLSGHTHRGQMTPNHLITRRLFELDWGYKQKGRLHAVVSSGYGTWGPPIRLGSRSEIIRLVIRFRTPA
ncbi:metallophosphoesterase [Paenibacillus koleovorans]|uniref:metallophosphoesterase n=1 Tax=Paenibacillus koleovorans TaxID=121608 RepID=UPI000FD9870C|nr:metallophosphoesterase [Paenibacillus koleovorans]